MSFHREKHTVSISGGTGTVTTDLSQRGLLWQIFIEPTTETTTWDMEIHEARSGDEVLGWSNQTGSTNSAFGLELPFSGYYTLTILNASVDENFTWRITVKEPVYAN